MATEKVRIVYDVDFKDLKLSEDAIKRIAKEFGVTEDEVEAVNKGLKKQVGIIEKLEKEEKDLLELRRKSQDPKQIKKLNGQIASTKGKMDKLTGSTNGFKSQIASLGPAIIATFAVGALKKFGEASIEAFADFESSIQSLKAITGASGDDLEKLKNSALEFGKGIEFFDEASKKTFTLSVAAADAAKAFELLGSKKPELLPYPDLLADVTKQALILSKASGLDLPTSIDALAGSMNQFGAGAEQASRFVDTFAAAAQAGSAPIPELTESFKNVGAILKVMNIEVEDGAALIETLADKQFTGSQAGIKLRNVLLKLRTDQKLYTDGVFDTTKALESLKKRSLDAAQFTKDFGTENVVIAQILGDSVGRFEELRDKIGVSGKAMEQAAANAVTYETAQENAKNAVNALLITVGEKLAPFIQEAADLVAEFARRFDELGAELAPIGALFGLIGDAFAAIGFDTMAGDLDLVGEGFKFVGFIVRSALLGPLELVNVTLKEFFDYDIFKELGLVAKGYEDFGTEVGALADGIGVSSNELIKFAESSGKSKEALIGVLQQLKDGKLSAEEKAAAFAMLSKEFETYQAEAIASATATDELGGSVEKNAGKAKAAAGSIADLGKQIATLKKELTTTNPSQERQAEILKEIAMLSAEVAIKVRDQKDAYAESLNGQIQDIEKLSDLEKVRTLTAEQGAKRQSEAYQKSLDEQLEAAEAHINEIERLEEESEARKKQVREALIDVGFQAVGALQTLQQAALDKQLGALETQKQKELALAEGNEQKQAEIEDRYAKIAGDKKKKNAIKEIAINTAIAIVKAYASMDPILASIAAVGILITSAAQVALVNSQQFATGVIDLQGPGTGTSDSIPARLSKGESVMTAKETREFKPLLNGIRNGQIKSIDDLYINPLSLMRPSVNVNGMNERKVLKRMDRIIGKMDTKDRRYYA